MAEEGGRENRGKKVIPYDQTFGAQNANLTETRAGSRVSGRDIEDGDENSSYPDGLRELDAEDTEITGAGPLDGSSRPPLRAVGPPAGKDQDPEEPLRSAWEDDAEAAREVADWGPTIRKEEERTPETEEEAGGLDARDEDVWGITGLILSIGGLFIWPIILGAAGMIVGFFSFRRGARTTGILAMAIGAFALLMALFILPTFFR